MKSMAISYSIREKVRGMVDDGKYNLLLFVFDLYNIIIHHHVLVVIFAASFVANRIQQKI
jgi:hypothetical protein